MVGIMTRQTAIALGIIALFYSALSVAWVIYQPGLTGSFIFDDLTNLAPLGGNAGVVDWQSFTNYIRSGFSGPTGRPLSLLSFLIDANNWPAPPEPFKRTNILLHLLNGCLLFWLTHLLVSVMDDGLSSTKKKIVALIVAALWLFHPYLVSTTLYVVQRMAILSTLFVFFGLITWLKGRMLLGQKPRLAYCLMSLGLFVFSVLAVLSKENGAILPALALAMEFFLLRDLKNLKRPAMLWQATFLLLPTLIILSYLVYIPMRNGLFSDYVSRDFSPWERLLTQFRVLWIYIFHWFVPKMTTTGVFHDQILVSQSIIKPWTTLLSVIGWLGTIFVIWKLRRRLPLLAMSLFVWLGSVLIESSTVGLEMLFEHRMYMGGGFLFLPAVYYGSLYAKPWKFTICGGIALMVLASFCWRGAMLWGHYPTMIMVWAEKAPDSARAQIEVARMLYETGNHLQAAAWLDRASQRIPQDFPLRFSQMLTRCRTDRVSKEDRDVLVQLSNSQKYSHTWFNLMQRSIDWSSKDSCIGLSPVFVGELSKNFLDQGRYPSNTQSYAQLTYLFGISQLYAGKIDVSVEYLNASVSSREDAQKLMSSAAYLATFGVLGKALEYAERAKKIVESGNLHGRALGEAPQLSDINVFIEAVKKDGKDKIEHRHSGQK
ncbi:hypothetical protein [Alloalcanivorax marinus]|uniref:hypothetical protein n=1 Tax=Alloalcanivorax marinus TaxID=1177169 RepID=UPI00193193C5|nr:hypothetical protein [Alloalcanivorax marinus]MBL7251763.1 hypothetical protein [Alloalcanivorax marinus]